MANAEVTITGTAAAPVLNFKIPRGNPGADSTVPGPSGTAATVTVGTVATGAAGSSAAVTGTGTPQARVLNFTIPKGDKGDAGAASTVPGPAGVSPVFSIGTVETV